MSRCALLVRLAVLFGLVALNGCFNYTEQIQFDEKGAGKMQIVFDQAELGPLEKLAAATVKKNPFDTDRETMEKDLPAGVKLTEYKEETKDKRKLVYITYTFDDLNKLAQWKQNDSSDLVFRNLSLSSAGDVWVFRRLAKTRHKDQLEDGKKHLTGSKIVFKLTGPGKLIKEKSNPHRIENENTCVWEGSFPELLGGENGQGTDMRAQYFVGTPMWVKVAIVVVVLAVIAGVVVVSKRRKPAAPEAPKNGTTVTN